MKRFGMLMRQILSPAASRLSLEVDEKRKKKRNAACHLAEKPRKLKGLRPQAFPVSECLKLQL